jgi:hypothetical protein
MVELATSTGSPGPWTQPHVGYQPHFSSPEYFYLPESFSLRFEGPSIFASFLVFKRILEHRIFNCCILFGERGRRKV